MSDLTAYQMMSVDDLVVVATLHLCGLDNATIAGRVGAEESVVWVALASLGYGGRRQHKTKAHCGSGHPYAVYGKPLVRRRPDGRAAKNGRDCYACIATREGHLVPSPEYAAEMREGVIQHHIDRFRAEQMRGENPLGIDGDPAVSAAVAAEVEADVEARKVDVSSLREAYEKALDLARHLRAALDEIERK